MARNFLKSMLLLGVAMLAALYANSSARDGRVFQSAIGAFIAISIAIWVGIRFVPRLASGIDWDWLSFFTHYRLTRDGWIYIAATTIVMSAAINTSNNPLYMVLSALLAVMLLSGFLSGLNFRFLKVSARGPDHCFAKQPFQMAISVKNPKRVFPTFSVEVRPVDESPFEFPAFYAPLIRTEEVDTRMVETTLPGRGRHTLEEVQLQSRYPFGFLMKGRPFRVHSEYIAFPEIVPQETLDLAIQDILGSTERFERGQGMDLYMIRDHQASDNARYIDWKASAKTARLKTREFAAEESRRVVFTFDRYGQKGETRGEGRGDEERFERMVSHAASLTLYLIRDGVELCLISDDWSSASGRSEHLLQSILRYLALVEMTPAPGQPVTTSPDDTVLFSLRGPSNMLAHTTWNDTSKSHSMR